MDNVTLGFQWEGLFHSPDIYLLEFLDKQGQVLFVRMSRECYQRSIFTDRQRIVPAQPTGQGINLNQLLERSDRDLVQRPLRYIFHLAHGGSTLLARALDFPGRDLVIREPFPLRQLAVDRLAVPSGLHDKQRWARKLRLVTGLLGRRYQETEPVLVKANVPVNFMLPELLSLNESSCGVMLYCGLTQYLASVLKSPDHQRWVVNVLSQLAGGVRKIDGLESVITGKLAPPQAAACLWLSQMACYTRALALFPNLKTLRSDDFFEKPVATLRAASEFMELGFPDADIEEIVGGELFTVHAKHPGVAYNNAARKADYERLLLKSQSAISEGLEWAEPFLVSLDLPEALPNSLI